MKLSAPKVVVWWIALILLVLSIIAFFVPAVKDFALWVAVVSSALMLIATAVSGL